MAPRARVPSPRPWLGLCVALCVLVLVPSGCGDDPDIPDCETDEASETCQVFRLVNIERADEGLPAYAWSTELALSAQLHAEDMDAQGYFDHASLDGRSFSDRAQESGYAGFPRGENIAMGQQTPEQVMDSWMSSPGHRSNILSDADEIGVGFANFYWVQVFGQP